MDADIRTVSSLQMIFYGSIKFLCSTFSIFYTYDRYATRAMAARTTMSARALSPNAFCTVTSPARRRDSCETMIQDHHRMKGGEEEPSYDFAQRR